MVHALAVEKLVIVTTVAQRESYHRSFALSVAKEAIDRWIASKVRDSLHKVMLDD